MLGMASMACGKLSPGLIFRNDNGPGQKSGSVQTSTRNAWSETTIEKPCTKTLWHHNIANETPRRCRTHYVHNDHWSKSETAALVLWIHYKFGNRRFLAADPWLWNDLPSGPWQPDLYLTFIHKLEMLLFGHNTYWLFGFINALHEPSFCMYACMSVGKWRPCSDTLKENVNMLSSVHGPVAQYTMLSLLSTNAP